MIRLINKMLKYTVMTIPNSIDLNVYVVNSKYTYNVMYIIVHIYNILCSFDSGIS